MSAVRRHAITKQLRALAFTKKAAFRIQPPANGGPPEGKSNSISHLKQAILS
jgi:hypothetical protein